MELFGKASLTQEELELLGDDGTGAEQAPATWVGPWVVQ
jgi:hypothetical protein